MPYIGVCSRDGHRFFAKTQDSLSSEMRIYAIGHGYDSEDFLQARISRAGYADYKANRDDPIWWILHQGDALDELRPGQKELLASILRNIPKPKDRGHRNKDYLRAWAKGFRMNPPRDLARNRI